MFYVETPVHKLFQAKENFSISVSRFFLSMMQELTSLIKKVKEQDESFFLILEKQLLTRH